MREIACNFLFYFNNRKTIVSLCFFEVALYVKLQGSKNYPVIFGQLTKKDGSFLISRKEEPNFQWSDLKGKEVIGGRKGGMPAMSLEYAMKANDLLSQGASINYDVQFDLITAAFESGTGDYCTMFEPAASEFQKAGKGYIVASVGAEAGDVPYTCFMATKSYISENNDKVTKFMRAVNKGIKYVMENDDELVAAALKNSFQSTSLEMLTNAVKSYKEINAFMETPVMSEAQFAHMLDILMESGTITERVAFADIIDNSIVEAL